MEQFAGYGFNKSHSAAYAFLAFVTAYLKAHYPVDFMAALLTSETGNVAKVVKYINECREMNIRVLPPDVNASELHLHAGARRTGRCHSLRPGRGEERGPGRGRSDHQARAKKWAASNRIYQFCEHADMSAINRRVMESLIKAGAMDSLEGTRAQLLLALDGAIEAGNRAAQRSRQRAGRPVRRCWLPKIIPNPRCPKPTTGLCARSCRARKSCSASTSPAIRSTAYEEKICELATHDSSKLEGLEKGAEVALCGMITGIQRRRNREGKPWASMVIEDRVGIIEGMVFTTAYEGLLPLLVEDQAVLIRGSALPEEGNPTKVSIKEIVPLDVVARAAAVADQHQSVRMGRNGIDRAAELQNSFERKPGDTQVRLRLESARDFSVILDVPAKVRPDKEFKGEIARICGQDMLEVMGH